MTHPAEKAASLNSLRKADQVIGVRDLNGWERPKDYLDALEMVNAARSAQNVLPAIPPLPQKPKDVGRWIDAATDARVRESARADVVTELLVRWQNTAAAAGLATLADTADRLVNHFDELLAEFDSLADAPRTLTGYETDEEAESHRAALRIAADLTNAVMQRSLLADACGESEDLNGDLVWLVLDPAPSTTRNEVDGAVARFKSTAPATLADWDDLQQVGRLRLAAIGGEIASRRSRHSEFVHWVSMNTADLGMQDHAYSEFEGSGPSPAYGAALQADNDAIFDSAPQLSI